MAHPKWTHDKAWLTFRLVNCENGERKEEPAYCISLITTIRMDGHNKQEISLVSYMCLNILNQQADQRLLSPCTIFSLNVAWITNSKLVMGQCRYLKSVSVFRFYRAASNKDAVYEREFCPSVRPSVRLSNAWFVTKLKKICPDFYPIRKMISSSFLSKRTVGGERPPLREILGQPAPVEAKSPIFNRHSLVAPQP